MRILVVYATAGAGHKKAAEAIYQAFKSKEGYYVRLIDALDYTRPSFKKSYPRSYAFLVTHLSWIWGIFFALLDLPWMQSFVRSVRRLYNGFNAMPLHHYLIQEEFDCIITTQFLSAEVSAYLKRTGKISARIICVVTDFDVHRIWLNEGIDIYTGACDYTRDKLLALGVPSEKVYVTGIPTDAKFAAPSDKSALRKKLGLGEKMTVLIATGSFGMGPIEELMKLLGEHQLLIVCGHNWHLYQRLKPLAGGSTHIYGLVDNMDELMSAADVMVTKPGGLSIAEALVKRLPMIFFSAIPGQETNNIKVLNSYGIVPKSQCSLQQIARTINELDSNPNTYNALRQRMNDLSKPDAADDIIALLNVPLI